MMESLFNIEDIEFGIKFLAKGKIEDTEGYQAEILKIGSSILIPHIQSLFNILIKDDFPKFWM